MGDAELKCKEVTCRKEHRCEWCNGKIEIKEKAISRSYVFMGDFNSTHQHPECFVAMEKSSDEIWDGFQAGDQLRGKTYNESHS